MQEWHRFVDRNWRFRDFHVETSFVSEIVTGILVPFASYGLF